MHRATKSRPCSMGAPKTSGGSPRTSPFSPTSGSSTERIWPVESVVLAALSFSELLRGALPITAWWQRSVTPIRTAWTRSALKTFAKQLTTTPPGSLAVQGTDPKLLQKLIRIVGYIDLERRGKPVPDATSRARRPASAQPVDLNSRVVRSFNFLRIKDLLDDHLQVKASAFRPSQYRRGVRLQAEGTPYNVDTTETGIPRRSASSRKSAVMSTSPRRTPSQTTIACTSVPPASTCASSRIRLLVAQ